MEVLDPVLNGVDIGLLFIVIEAGMSIWEGNAHRLSESVEDGDFSRIFVAALARTASFMVVHRSLMILTYALLSRRSFLSFISLILLSVA